MTSFAKREIGSTGLEVSVLGLGGGPLGDLFEIVPEDRALATLETAYAAGLRLYDTSPYYGHGMSEHRFGHALRTKPRDELVLSTNVGRVLTPRGR